MRYAVVLLLLLATPVAAQEPIALMRASSRSSPLAPLSGGLGVQIDSRHWYIDFSVELMSRSLRHRRVAVSADYFMLTTDSSDIGLELTYWKLGFRRRSIIIGDIERETERQGRAIMAGPVVRRPGPWHSEISGAVLAGWYTNRIDSASIDDEQWMYEPISSDDAAIGGVRLGLKLPVISSRVSVGGSVRYFRLWGDHPWWVPKSEWSGEVALDVRTLSRRKKALFVGALVRLGPRGPGLVTDRTFGIRMKWKVR